MNTVKKLILTLIVMGVMLLLLKKAVIGTLIVATLFILVVKTYSGSTFTKVLIGLLAVATLLLLIKKLPVTIIIVGGTVLYSAIWLKK